MKQRNKTSYTIGMPWHDLWEVKKIVGCWKICSVLTLSFGYSQINLNLTNRILFLMWVHISQSCGTDVHCLIVLLSHEKDAFFSKRVGHLFVNCQVTHWPTIQIDFWFRSYFQLRKWISNRIHPTCLTSYHMRIASFLHHFCIIFCKCLKCSTCQLVSML